MYEINKFNQKVGTKVTNWRPARKPSKENFLQGNYSILKPLDINNHTEKLFEAFALHNQGESWTYLPYGPFKNLNSFKIWLKEKMSETETFLYTVMDINKNMPIGITGFLRINLEHGVIEVGHIHYSTLLKKTTIATETMYLMMQYVFEKLGYRRYEWKCHALNQASWNAALRLGFKFEGIFRQSNIFKNRNRDTEWFSIIDSEWPVLKKKFQHWLRPENFDSSGNQLQSLNKC